KSVFLPNGQNDVIFFTNLNPSSTSFQIPTNAHLAVGGNYVINFQVIDTRSGQPLPPNAGNADILTRSNSFFDFSPPSRGSPVIQLPNITPDGVYHFNVGSVGPNAMTFIDPLVAIGYIYDIGADDPNFASVLLPNVGGGHFQLSYLFNGNQFLVPLDAGVQ